MSEQKKLPYIYVDDQTALDQAAAQLNNTKQLSVDLEFDKNRFRYGFNLCLIQIFDGTQTYLIDPVIAELDLKPIFEVFENPDINKIVFSFGEDIRLLHSMGCFPRGLYDLQMVSALLNYPPASLATLLQDVLGITLSKASQQSNWFRRPLSDEQINYAILDVIHLPDLYDVFVKHADERGVSDWIDQEMHHFETQNYEDADQNEILKEKYKGDMTEVEWHIFSKLMHFRDRHAESVNRPPYHISERRTITDIAKNPKKAGSWMSINSNHHSTKNNEFVDELHAQIDSALQEAQALELSRRKKAYKKPTKEEYERYRDLEHQLKVAKLHFFKPIQKGIKEAYGDHTKTFILNNRLIKELVEGNKRNLLPYKEKLIKDIAINKDLDYTQYLPSKRD